MTYIITYIAAVLADLYTTHRALKASPTAREAHPILSRLFGPRPEAWQLLVYGAAETAALVWIIGWLAGAYWPLVPLIAVHGYHAYRNHRRLG